LQPDKNKNEYEDNGFYIMVVALLKIEKVVSS